MKIKASELIGPALNWAVSKAEGCSYCDYMEYGSTNHRCWSTDWAQGGPIIEREKIGVWISEFPDEGLWCAAPEEFTSSTCEEFDEKMTEMSDPIHGPSPLIAAMRCYVVSKLGDEIEIPEELL